MIFFATEYIAVRNRGRYLTVWIADDTKKLVQTVLTEDGHPTEIALLGTMLERQTKDRLARA